MKHILRSSLTATLTIFSFRAVAHTGHTQQLHFHLFEYSIIALLSLGLAYYFLAKKSRSASVEKIRANKRGEQKS